MSRVACPAEIVYPDVRLARLCYEPVKVVRESQLLHYPLKYDAPVELWNMMLFRGHASPPYDQ